MREPILGRAMIAMEATLRLATTDDLPALEWFGMFTPHREVIATAFRMQERGDGAMLLAVVNGFPAGQAWLDFVRRRPHGRATVWAVRVFPPFQHSRLGTRLMLTAESVIRDRGFGESELGVDRDNPGVLGFYERLGYRGAGTETGRFSYRTPEGAMIHQPIDQWILRKALATTPARSAAS